MSEELKNNPLATVPTTDLIDELVNRCEPAVFIGYKNEGIIAGVNTFYEFKGKASVCVGLCHQMAHDIVMEDIKEFFESRDNDV